MGVCAWLVLIAALLLLALLPSLNARVRSVPTETAAHAQLVTMAAIQMVSQVFKQLPVADVPRATTLRMA